jgi:hypothetical protein
MEYQAEAFWELISYRRLKKNFVTRYFTLKIKRRHDAPCILGDP